MGLRLVRFVLNTRVNIVLIVIPRKGKILYTKLICNILIDLYYKFNELKQTYLSNE